MAEEEIPGCEVAGGDAEVEVLKTGHLEAYELFMRFVPAKAIAEHLRVNESTIIRWIRKNGWRKERDKLQRDVKNAAKFKALRRLNSITENGLAIVDASIRHALSTYKEHKRAPSVSEARIILEIVQKSHAMKIVEEGEKGGDVIAGMNPQDVMDAFMNDPYMRKALEEGNTGIELGPTDASTYEDSVDTRNSERSASQEARSSLTGSEQQVFAESGAVSDRPAPVHPEEETGIR
jgi:hypothetical protein